MKPDLVVVERKYNFLALKSLLSIDSKKNKYQVFQIVIYKIKFIVIQSGMTKYRQYLLKMLNDNKRLFEDFKKIHDEYSLIPEALQKEFNEQGEKVLEVIREYENRLCANTERGMYNKFSTQLADKFQNEVRTHFPMIDHIGLKVDSSDKSSQSDFFLRKINLS